MNHDLKKAHLRHLAAEIKLDEAAAAREAKRQRTAKRPSGIEAIELARKANATGQAAYDLLSGVKKQEKVPESLLRIQCFNHLKDTGESLSLDELIVALNFGVTERQKEMLNAFLRSRAQLTYSNGKFTFKAALSWVKTEQDLITLLKDEVSGITSTVIKTLYESAVNDTEKLVALKQVLKVACPEQKKKDQVLYVWNYHHDLQLPNITEEMKQLWSNISIPDEPNEFEKGMKQRKIEMQKQEKKIVQVKDSLSGNKRKRNRKIKVHNTHLGNQFDFNKDFTPVDKLAEMQSRVRENEAKKGEQ